MLDRAHAIADQLIGWRRFVHQHAEPAFQEYATARLVAEALSAMSIPIQTGVGKTGVVGRIGHGPPVIALRADMDALPVQEETGLPFASQNPGVMHACGHDAHVACLLGAASLLSASPPTKGEVRLIFQPAEEGPDDEDMSGAMRMAQAGVMEGADAIVGLHIWTEVPAGQVSFSPGPQMASAGKFEARIHGHGGHGAMPHRTVDPIVLAAQAIMALQTVVSRRVDPLDAAVVTVTSIHGGTSHNIIPEHVDLLGTLRALTPEVCGQLEHEIERALGIVRALGGDVDVEFGQSYGVVYNDPTLTAFVTEVATDLLGADAVTPARPVMGGEDFGVLAEGIPGCYLRLGGGFPGQPLRNHHDAHFDIDEAALPIGATVLAAIAARYLSR